MPIQDPFETSDLYLSAAFRAAGVKMIDTRRQGSRLFFVFERYGDGMLEKLMNDYFNKNLKIDACTYATEIKTLKTLCYTSES